MPSHLVAKYAQGKGQSYWLFLILGLATSFVVSLVLALILGQNSGGTDRQVR